MSTGSSRPRAAEVIADLAADGRYHFTAKEIRAALGVSDVAARLALSRLGSKGLIASPARGFYVILPPEYRRLGSLPADQFIPALMDHAERPYYAGFLSAAQYHGAAHHRPQAFQVAVANRRRPISCGAVRVEFITRKRVSEVPVRTFNTPRGTIRVSSVEATALDLVGYEKRVGGLDHVATLLSELAERIDPELLAVAAQTAPIPWAQRLGYLLEHVGAADRASALKAPVQQRARDMTWLQPSGSHNRAARASDWRLRINAQVEADV